MSLISDVFRGGRKKLIAYVTAGYPSIEATFEAVPLLARAGCDVVEIGIPFSDPLADGATIQKASFHSLHNGVTPQVCLDVAAQIRKKTDVPLVFMSYYNPIYNYGLKSFAAACSGAGVNGLIIPDLPPEEGTDLETITSEQGIDLIYLLAPTSTEERIRKVAEHSRGFIYLVSITGVTGARHALPRDLEDFVCRVRSIAAQPLCVGFGISTPEQARQVAGCADGVIVGSKLVQLLNESGWKTRLEEFVKELRAALDRDNN